jgi:hypothetical protein
MSPCRENNVLIFNIDVVKLIGEICGTIDMLKYFHRYLP